MELNNISQNYENIALWGIARMFLKFLQRIFSLSVVLKTSQKVPEKYRRLPLFGAGKNVPEVWWKALGRALVIESYLAESSGYNKFTTLCKITPKVTILRDYRK